MASISDFNKRVINRMAEQAAIRDGIDRTGFMSWMTQVNGMLHRENPTWPEEDDWKLVQNAYSIASVLRGHASDAEKREALAFVSASKEDCARLRRNRLARERRMAKRREHDAELTRTTLAAVAAGTYIPHEYR